MPCREMVDLEAAWEVKGTEGRVRQQQEPGELEKGMSGWGVTTAWSGRGRPQQGHGGLSSEGTEDGGGGVAGSGISWRKSSMS